MRLTDFETLLETHWPLADWRDLTALVAVSGGADSVALLRGLQTLSQKAGARGMGRLMVAHFNHKLRAQADSDQRFVESLANQWGLEVIVGEPRQPLTTDASAASEAAARQARYEFLQRAAAAAGARYVVTAHTADDQAETVLHHVLRGTGLAGLAGMARARELAPGVALLRPLLTVRRSVLRAYLSEIGQSFVEDATNQETRFTRNRLRAELLPRLAEDYNPQVVEALERLGVLAGDAQAALDAWAAELASACVRRVNDRQLQILAAPLLTRPRHIVREVLIRAWGEQGWPRQSMGFAEWESLAEMLLAPPLPRDMPLATRVLPGGIQAQKPGESLVLTRLASNSTD